MRAGATTSCYGSRVCVQVLNDTGRAEVGLHDVDMSNAHNSSVFMEETLAAITYVRARSL